MSTHADTDNQDGLVLLGFLLLPEERARLYLTGDGLADTIGLDVRLRDRDGTASSAITGLSAALPSLINNDQLQYNPSDETDPYCVEVFDQIQQPPCVVAEAGHRRLRVGRPQDGGGEPDRLQCRAGAWLDSVRQVAEHLEAVGEGEELLVRPLVLPRARPCGLHARVPPALEPSSDEPAAGRAGSAGEWVTASADRVRAVSSGSGCVAATRRRIRSRDWGSRGDR
ncbi:hypothetical protein [Streptomyces sp. NPDC056401]|uniref:hypothetical protein n=1 Tax=Streptomyces sp. NPDC056401 TaxID=3345809 RepID=UPI0035E38EAE